MRVYIVFIYVMRTLSINTPGILPDVSNGDALTMGGNSYDPRIESIPIPSR